jgi:hypothetical protein
VIAETYRGRRVWVAGGTNLSTPLRVKVNGEPVATGQHFGEADRPSAALAEVRRQIDFIDLDPVPDGDRWEAHWYAPGTYELCPSGHPREVGGACRHFTCQREEDR